MEAVAEKQEVKPSDILLAARELVAKGWTQGTYAKDAKGRSVLPDVITACCWCVSGARLRAIYDLGLDPGDDPSRRAGVLLRRTCGSHPPDFNDDPETDHMEAVLAVERAAVMALREEGAIA